MSTDTHAGRTESGQVDYSMGGAPRPDSLFREYTFRFARAELPVLDPGATHPIGDRIRANPRTGKAIQLQVDDLRDAVSAEMVIEYWGGHLGTSHQGFHVNGGPWRPIPQPVGTPSTPLAYYRMMLGGASVPIPLDELRQGVNEVLFTAGPQIAHNFDLGFYWIYSCTLRVCYAAGSKPHPTADLVWPAAGQTIGEMPALAAKCREGFTSIRQVDFLAKYEDFPWSGNGIYHQWHLQSHWGQYRHHAGMTDHTVTDEPLSCTWDTNWVPDQDRPLEFMARIMSLDGVCSTTPVTCDVRLERRWRRVKMIKPTNVPEAFGARVKERKSCTLSVPSLRGATTARLLVSTWSAGHADQIGINRTALFDRIGRVHDHSFDLLPVPLSLLREGDNEFFIYAETEHHMIEVNWPGPVLLVEYSR